MFHDSKSLRQDELQIGLEKNKFSKRGSLDTIVLVYKN